MKSRAFSTKTAVQRITLLDSKLISVRLCPQRTTSWRFSLTLKRHTTRRGNTASYAICITQPAGLRGRMPDFIAKFLNNRKFRVRVGSHLSDKFDQEMGALQGSILSVTLFVLKINSIVQSFLSNVCTEHYIALYLQLFDYVQMRPVNDYYCKSADCIKLWFFK